MFANRKRFRRERPNISRLTLNLSQNYDAILNSIEEIDGESTTFSTVENLTITSTDGIKMDIEFRLFFNVGYNQEQEPNQDPEMIVDYESAEDIRIITNCQNDEKILNLIEKIPINDNDIINLLLDDLVDNWDKVEILTNSDLSNE
jgi:hypothetical protein